MPGKQGAKRVPVNDIAVIPKIAAMLACGKTRTEIAQTLELGFNTVVRLSQTDGCKAIVKEIGDSYKEVAKAEAVKAVCELTTLAISGLKKALTDGNMEAIKTHFKVIGILGIEEQKQAPGQQSLTIVMPGAHVEKPALEIENGDEDLQLGPDQEAADDSP